MLSRGTAEGTKHGSAVGVDEGEVQAKVHLGVVWRE